MAMKWFVLYCIYIGQFCTFPGNIYWQDNNWHFSAFRMYAHSYHQCFRLQRTTFSQRMNLKSNSYMFSINCVTFLPHSMFDLVGQSDHDKFSAFSSLHFSLLKSDLSLVQFAQRWSLKSPLHPMPMPKPIKSSCNYKIWSVKCLKEIFQNHIYVLEWLWGRKP